MTKTYESGYADAIKDVRKIVSEFPGNGFNHTNFLVMRELKRLIAQMLRARKAKMKKGK